MTKLTHVLTALFVFWKCPGRISGEATANVEYFVIFLSPSKQVPKYSLKSVPRPLPVESFPVYSSSFDMDVPKYSLKSVPRPLPPESFPIYSNSFDIVYSEMPTAPLNSLKIM